MPEPPNKLITIPKPRLEPSAAAKAPMKDTKTATLKTNCHLTEMNFEIGVTKGPEISQPRSTPEVRVHCVCKSEWKERKMFDVYTYSGPTSCARGEPEQGN